MICISKFCPKYAECGRTIPHDHWEQCIDLGSSGSVIITGDGRNETKYWCGIAGDYAFFIPKDKSEV